MENDQIEALVKGALATGEAAFEIDVKRNALILSVAADSTLVGLLDAIFNKSLASLVPLDQRRTIEAISVFKIDQFTVSASVRDKRVKNNRHLYDFIYTPKTNS